MNATDYWPMAREYLAWNTAIAALQFWTADLKAHTLSSDIEEVYSVFFTQHQHIHYVNNLTKYYLVTL